MLERRKAKGERAETPSEQGGTLEMAIFFSLDHAEEVHQEAKVYTYEKIIANSNFAPMIKKEQERSSGDEEKNEST